MDENQTICHSVLRSIYHSRYDFLTNPQGHYQDLRATNNDRLQVLLLPGAPGSRPAFGRFYETAG